MFVFLLSPSPWGEAKEQGDGETRRPSFLSTTPGPWESCLLPTEAFQDFMPQGDWTCRLVLLWHPKKAQGLALTSSGMASLCKSLVDHVHPETLESGPEPPGVQSTDCPPHKQNCKNLS